MRSNILKEIPFQPSTIETIDYSIFDWLKKLNLHTNTNNGWKPVDIIWVSAERSFQVKDKKERRDIFGTVNYPLIMLGRESITKDPSRKGTAWADVPAENDFKGGSAAITIARRINQDKTSNFVNAETRIKKGQLNFPRKSNKIVYETMSIPMPVYITVMYTVMLRTQYQQQMNDLLQPFITKPGAINYQLFKRDGHRFEAFIEQNFVNNSNEKNIGIEERLYQTDISIRVLGHLIGRGKNQEQPKIVIRENAVDVKIPREYVIFGDTKEYAKFDGFKGISNVNGHRSGSL